MKYWVYMNGEVPGSYEPSELARIPDFTSASMVCPTDGSPAERNWQRAGLFPEIARVLIASHAASPPHGGTSESGAPPRPLPTPPISDFSAMPPGPIGPEQVLKAAGHRLFRHVTEIMKELENRREERALTQSLQRNLVELKNELLAARERVRSLEGTAALIPGYEERERRLQELLEKTRADLSLRERALKSLMREMEEAQRKLEESRHALAELTREKQQLGQIGDALNLQLAEKELSLSKALGLIRRLEEELGRILPDAPNREPPNRSVPHGDRASEGDMKPSPPIREAPPRGDERVGGPIPIVSPAASEPPPAPLSTLALASEPIPEAPPPQAAPPSWPVQPPALARTDDDGRAEHPVPMPPEGELAPIRSPLTQALERLSGIFKSFL